MFLCVADESFALHTLPSTVSALCKVNFICRLAAVVVLPMTRAMASIPNIPNVNSGTSVLVVIWILAGIAICVGIVRLISRAKTAGHLSADDYVMTLSLVSPAIACFEVNRRLRIYQLSGLVCTALVSSAVASGLGRHPQYLDPDQRFNALKFEIIEQPFVVLSPDFGRIPFAMFLIQILRKSMRQRRFLYFTIVCQLIVNIITAILFVIQC